MPLTLSETAQLRFPSGALYQRTLAACGLIGMAFLTDSGSTDAQRAWATSMRADPDAVAADVYNGVILTSQIQAANLSDLQSGEAPTDAELLAIVTGLLTQFGV